MEKAWRYDVGQPNAVVAAEEDVPGFAHGPGIHLEDHRHPSPGADGARGLPIRREVDVVALHGSEALGEDRLQEALHRAVVEPVRGLGRREAEIDCDAVALVRPDALPVRREAVAALAVGPDELLHRLAGGAVAAGLQRLQEALG